VDWLIESQLMPADGSVSFPKKIQHSTPNGQVLQTTSQSSINSTLKSSASQVPELCANLGFNLPTYVLKRALESEPLLPLWNGYAHFNGDPRISGKVGAVESVFGKLNAKEEIAKEVLSFLKDIERQRAGSRGNCDSEALNVL
jgi:hypothetical protein